MSALRLAQPNKPVHFIDLGSQPWVPLHGHATLRGHVVVGASGDVGPVPSMKPSAVRMRALRERQA